MGVMDPRIGEVNSHDFDFTLSVQLQRFISCGMFYFATANDNHSLPIDLTLSAQRRALGKMTDSRFFW